MNYFPVGKKVKKQKFIPMLTRAGYTLERVSNSASGIIAAAIVYKNEIHLLGGDGNKTGWKSHRKIDVKTDAVIDVGTLPFEFDRGSAVVLNDEIHLLGSNREPTKHYKWDGKTWTEVSTIPFNVYYSVAVVLNGEIHLIGGANNSNVHYKWDGGTWTQVGTAPWGHVGDKAAVVINGEIHLLASYDNDGYHYKWNGETWIKLGALPSLVYYKMAASCDNVIYYASTSGSAFYTWTESSNKWVSHGAYNDTTFRVSPCNVYFGGWHIFGYSNGVIDHSVVGVPVYIPVD